METYLIKPPVNSKADFVRRYKAGEFGNGAPTWNTYKDWEQDNLIYPDPPNLFHIRNRVAGGKTWYNVPDWQVDIQWRHAIRSGIDPALLYISGMAPHNRGTIQGEVIQTENHLELIYTGADVPMRDAFTRYGTLSANGLTAIGLLKQYFNPNSWEWFQHLLDTYPGHVIEFTAFECNWGTVPHENVVWWEIRRY